MDFDLKFDFSSLQFDGGVKEESREIPKLSYEPVTFENAERMADSIQWGKNYIAIVSGSFIYGDFIEALLFKKSLKPEAMYITTLGMSRENVDSLVNLVDYLGCKKLNLIVSHYFAGVERHNLIPYMEQEFSGKPIDVAILQSHMKVCVIKSALGNAAIVGSANLSSSNNVEQFSIIHDQSTVDYLQSRLDGIMKRFTVIRGLDGAMMDWKANRDNTGVKAYKAIIGEAE